MEAIYSPVTAALAQEIHLEITANNVANVNTRGYRADRVYFSGTAGSVGSSFIPGIISEVVTDFTPGPIKTTGEALDVAIEGEGFFVVETPNGPRYTRNGHFLLNSEGELITASGYPVIGTGGSIALPTGQVEISNSGKISVQGPEVGAQPIELDSFLIVQFLRPDDFVKEGGTLFRSEGADPFPIEKIQLRQGAVEASNVDAVSEMVSLIRILRLYEAAQKAIQTADEVEEMASTSVGAIA